MADVNACVFTGHLTKDCVLKTVNSTMLCEINFAVNTGWGDNKITLFIKGTIWGKRGSSIAPYLQKGQFVGVSGSLSLNEWVDYQDEKRIDLVMNISDITLLPMKDTPAEQIGENSSVQRDEQLAF